MQISRRYKIMLNFRKNAAWPPGPETGGTGPGTKYTFEFDLTVKIPEDVIPDVSQTLQNNQITFEHPGLQDYSASLKEAVENILGPEAKEVHSGGGLSMLNVSWQISNLTETENYAINKKVWAYLDSLGMKRNESAATIDGNYSFSSWNVDDPQQYMQDENDIEGLEYFNNRYSGGKPAVRLQKLAGYTYTAELLSVMTQNLDRLSANYTADGAEAVVNFTSSETPDEDPQQYHIKITPMSVIEGRQEAENPPEGYNWGPEGPPPGISNARKLNMKKKALDIGGETFPDALKFKDETGFTDLKFDSAESVPDIFRHAENFVIDYIWAGLQAHGIVGPDDANVIQEDADKIRFSNASSLVHELTEEGWFKYIEQTPYADLKVDPSLQQKIYNAIKSTINEGAV